MRRSSRPCARISSIRTCTARCPRRRLSGRSGGEVRRANGLAVKAAFEARRSQIVTPDLDLAVYILLRVVGAIVHNAATKRLSARNSGVLTDEVTRMLVGYLTGKGHACI